MSCKKCQDLILTDYLDNELGEKQKNFLESHIDECADCKVFLDVVQKISIESLVNAKRDHVSRDAVWKKLQAEIHAEEVKYEHEVGFWERLKDFLSFPKPAFVFGTFAVLVLVFVANMNQMKNSQIKIADQEASDHIDHMAYIFDVGNSFNQYLTPLDDYFLFI